MKKNEFLSFFNNQPSHNINRPDEHLHINQNRDKLYGNIDLDNKTMELESCVYR